MKSKGTEQAKKELKEILLTYKPVILVINFIKLYRGVTFEQIRERIIKLSGSNMQICDHQAGVNCFTAMLLESEIISENKGIYGLKL